MSSVGICSGPCILLQCPRRLALCTCTCYTQVRVWKRSDRHSAYASVEHEACRFSPRLLYLALNSVVCVCVCVYAWYPIFLGLAMCRLMVSCPVLWVIIKTCIYKLRLYRLRNIYVLSSSGQEIRTSLYPQNHQKSPPSCAPAWLEPISLQNIVLCHLRGAMQIYLVQFFRCILYREMSGLVNGHNKGTKPSCPNSSLY